jgi:predicted Zn-dependent protease
MEQMLEDALGYQRLGLFAEARNAAETIPEGDSNWAQAQELLLYVDLDQERLADAASRAAKLLAKVPPGRTVVLNTALALHLAGDSQKAYNTLTANHEMFIGDGEAAYSFATYAASVGEVDFAIRGLLFNYQSSKSLGFKATIDADLEPIWIRGAAGNISLDSSLALAHPAMSEAVESSGAIQKEIPIDYIIKGQVPENSRDYLRIDPVSGFYTLDRETPPEIRNRYLHWQEDYKARTLRLARKAIQQTKGVVLDHQLEWAVEKAKAGNLLGARYHVIFALAQRPYELRRFAQVLSPLGMKYLFDELMYADSFEKAYVANLQRVHSAREAGEVAFAMELLDEIPSNLQSLTLSLLHRASNEDQRGNRHFAIRLYRKITRRWPQDPVGYYNAIQALMKQAMWDEAKRMIDQAPEGYRILAMSQMQRTQLNSRAALGKSTWEEPFYGQPVWDERLMIIEADNEDQLALEDI